MAQRGRPKKVVEVSDSAVEEKLDESTGGDPETSSLLSSKESLQLQLDELNMLRMEMQRLGVDSLSKLDALAGQVIAELNKL